MRKMTFTSLAAAILTTGCASVGGTGHMTEAPAIESDGTHSFAWNVMASAYLTKKSGPIKDAEIQTDGNDLSMVNVAVTGYLAGEGFAGRLINPPGISSDIAGGMFTFDLVSQVLKSATPPEPGVSRWIAWKPVSQMGKPETAKLTFAQELKNAYGKSLPSGYELVEVTKHWKNLFGRKQESIFNLIIGGNCKPPTEDLLNNTDVGLKKFKSFNFCIAVNSGEKYLINNPVKVNTPLWLRQGQQSYLFGSSQNNVPGNRSLTFTYPDQMVDGKLKNLDRGVFIATMSKVLSDNVFYYQAPEKDLPGIVPAVFNSGKAHYFVKPLAK